jgi:light-harvesting protein B-800-850 alpha chain
MNQGRIWTVVSPSVGLPLIIGGAAVTAIVVHLAILTHTTWFSGYWEGRHAKVSEITSTTAVSALEAPGFTVSIG